MFVAGSGRRWEGAVGVPFLVTRQQAAGDEREGDGHHGGDDQEMGGGGQPGGVGGDRAESAGEGAHAPHAVQAVHDRRVRRALIHEPWRFIEMSTRTSTNMYANMPASQTAGLRAAPMIGKLSTITTAPAWSTRRVVPAWITRSGDEAAEEAEHGRRP